MSMFEETREVVGITITVPIVATFSLVPPYRIDPRAIDVTTPRRANPARVLTAYRAGRDLARRGVVGARRSTVDPRHLYAIVKGGQLVHSDHIQARMFDVLSKLADRDSEGVAA